MKLIELKCPNCKAPIQVKEGTRQWFCGYCGTRLLVDDEIKRVENIVNVTHKTIDEARLLREQTIRETYNRKMSLYEKNHKIWLRFLIATIVSAAIIALFIPFMISEDGKTILGAIAVCLLYFGGIALALTHPKPPYN